MDMLYLNKLRKKLLDDVLLSEFEISELFHLRKKEDQDLVFKRDQEAKDLEYKRKKELLMLETNFKG